MLFRVEASKDTFELNPGLKAIPEFETLTERQITYVILSTDYKSPLRKLSPDERKHQAALIAGYKLDKKNPKRLDTNGREVILGKVSSIESAITRYKALQKDEDYETLISINILITQLRELNQKPDKNFQELAAIINMNVDKLDKLMKTKKNLEELLEMREDEPVEELKTSESTKEENLPILAQLNAGMLN